MGIQVARGSCEDGIEREAKSELMGKRSYGGEFNMFADACIFGC
jgi:hypothetical protein